MSSKTKKKSPASRASSRRFLRRPSKRKLILLAFAVCVTLLYADPLRAYFDKRGQLARERTEVARLEARSKALEEQVRSASTPQALERAARGLGYVKPGEHLYIVTGIKSWELARARHHDR